MSFADNGLIPTLAHIMIRDCRYDVRYMKFYCALYIYVSDHLSSSRHLWHAALRTFAISTKSDQPSLFWTCLQAVTVHRGKLVSEENLCSAL